MGPSRPGSRERPVKAGLGQVRARVRGHARPAAQRGLGARDAPRRGQGPEGVGPRAVGEAVRGGALRGAGPPQHLAGRAGWKAPFVMGAGPLEAVLVWWACPRNGLGEWGRCSHRVGGACFD